MFRESKQLVGWGTNDDSRVEASGGAITTEISKHMFRTSRHMRFDVYDERSTKLGISGEIEGPAPIRNLLDSKHPMPSSRVTKCFKS
jgi:hypothetical protein